MRGDKKRLQVYEEVLTRAPISDAATAVTGFVLGVIMKSKPFALKGACGNNTVKCYIESYCTY